MAGFYRGEKKLSTGTMLKNITISASDTIHCDENAKGSLNLGMRKNNATQESPEVISILKNRPVRIDK